MKAEKSKLIVGLRGILLKGGWGVRDENEVDADVFMPSVIVNLIFFIASIQCRCLLLRNTVACVALISLPAPEIFALAGQLLQVVSNMPALPYECIHQDICKVGIFSSQ